MNKEIQRDNNLEEANLHSRSSSTWFLVALEFGNVGYWGEGRTGVLGGPPFSVEEKREPTTIYLFIHLLKICLAVWQVRQQQNTMPPTRLNTRYKKNVSDLVYLRLSKTLFDNVYAFQM